MGIDRIVGEHPEVSFASRYQCRWFSQDTLSLHCLCPHLRPSGARQGLDCVGWPGGSVDRPVSGAEDGQ